jgi:hypothetical protein
MDSPLTGRVYDPRTAEAGGTNADDVTDALREFAVVTHKENTSPIWHREEQVRQQNPDLVISHLSCFLDVRQAGIDRTLRDHLFDLAQSRLRLFFGYVALVNPRTHFLVYSRGLLFSNKEAPATWARETISRFPQLEGRVHLMMVPGGDQASFRDPATVQLLRSRVKEILQLR